jgi:hypothetical protein
VSSPTGAGLISAVSTVPCSPDIERDTGNCAGASTLEAVLIKAAITAYSACIRRLRIAIFLGSAIPFWFDAVIRLHSRRATPLICGFARKPSGDSRLLPVTIPIIAGARRLHCYRPVSIQ